MTFHTKKLDERIVHINSLQERVLAADCHENYIVCGRGAGKTALMAMYHRDCVHEMPRSLRLILGPSYRKTVTDIIPGMMVQWEKMGYYLNVHYTIGNSPLPQKFGWDSPYYAPPEGYRNFLIHWYTGAGYRIGSADRKVTLNGLNLDGIDADETKLYTEDVFNEILKTNRANPDREWSHLPKHNSIIAFTDKYWLKKNSDWIMKKKALCDQNLIKDILLLQIQLDKLSSVVDGKVIYSDPVTANRIMKLLNIMRNKAVGFFEAASYVNMPALTPDYILQQKRNMGENEFRASMLNHDLVRNDKKEYFYPLLNETEHGYIADNFSKLDNLEFNFQAFKNSDCTFDEDLDSTLPIDISCDWGGNISCLVVAQEKPHCLNVINSFFEKGGGNIKELATRFNNYYRPHRMRDLRFYYDPSGNNTLPNSAETLSEEFARYLRASGWSVEMMHIGLHNNPRYELRYYLWREILKNKDKRDPKYPLFFMNKNNCKEVFVSMLDAGLKKYEKKLKKDKGSEKPGSGVLPEHATHFSDAVDYIVMHKYSYLLDSDNNVPSTMVE